MEVPEELGVDRVVADDVGLREPDAGPDLAQPVGREVVEGHRVPGEDGIELDLGHTPERVLEPRRGVGPGALPVREVLAERDLVDTDLVAHRHLGAVDRRRHDEEVAFPVLAGREIARHLPFGEAGREVGERGGHPVGADLGEGDLQARVPVEHPTRHQLPHHPPGLLEASTHDRALGVHRLGHEAGLLGRVVVHHVAGGGHHRRLADLGLHLREVDDAVVGAGPPGVHRDHQAEVLTGRPERLEVLVVEVRQVRTGERPGGARPRRSPRRGRSCSSRTTASTSCSGPDSATPNRRPSHRAMKSASQRL